MDHIMNKKNSNLVKPLLNKSQEQCLDRWDLCKHLNQDLGIEIQNATKKIEDNYNQIQSLRLQIESCQKKEALRKTTNKQQIKTLENTYSQLLSCREELIKGIDE